MIGFLFRIVLVFVLNALVLWATQTYLFPEKFLIEGGIHAYVYVGIVFTLLNILLKPIFHIIALPFRFLSVILASLVVNAALLFILEQSVNFIDMFETTITIHGILTYIVVGFIMSVANAVFHALGIE